MQSTDFRTRVKICGLTRLSDAVAASELGADALGLVFYPRSPRAVTIEKAREIVGGVPPFVSVVGLFVNPGRDEVMSVLDAVSLDILQFHGDETPEFCGSFGIPYLKALRVSGSLDLLKSARTYSSARGLLLDAVVEGFGGGGEVFDWSLIPVEHPLPIVLAGGLNPENVRDAIRRVRPWAVDVSSGVEAAKGVKDVAKMARFIAGVKHAVE